MTQSSTVQATLLYKTPPTLDVDALSEGLRELERAHGLPSTGAIRADGSELSTIALPFEITLSASDAPLPAATFNGALSANASLGERGPLSEMIVHHAGHIRMAVRDTGEDVPGWTRRGRLSALILAQDVARLLIDTLRPMALHWHQSNRLDLPDGLASSAAGTLFAPLCLRTRCILGVLDEELAGTMAQAILGAEDILDRPLHVMVPGLGLPETLDLASDFVAKMLEPETRPQPGATFTDGSGQEVQVVAVEPGRAVPAGLFALVGDIPLEGPTPQAALATKPEPKPTAPPSDAKDAVAVKARLAKELAVAGDAPPPAPQMATQDAAPAHSSTPSSMNAVVPRRIAKPLTDDDKLRRIFREDATPQRKGFFQSKR